MNTETTHLPGVTRSQNPWERMHWSKRQEDKEYWFWIVKLKLGQRKSSKQKRQVHIVRVARRTLDDANVPAGCKYLVDALQEFGHIWNDSRKWTRVTFDQRKIKDGEDEHMEITISPWAGG